MKNQRKNIPDNYQVGRGKPPPWCQWKPGESGNPYGRPPGRVSLETALKRELKKDGYRRTKEIIDSLISRASCGDAEALRLVWLTFDWKFFKERKKDGNSEGR